jgi:hypothetical protein
MNIKGETEINSYYGATISMISMVILLAYAGIRFDILQSNRDTIRSSIVVTDYFDDTTKFDMKANNFTIAFGLTDAKTHNVLDDPAYLEWKVTIDRWADGIY